MKVERYFNEQGTFDYVLSEENKKLFINFSGNGDLYFIFVKSNNCNSSCFEITKGNMSVYNVFLKLIMSLNNPKLHRVSSLELEFCETKEEVMQLYHKVEKYNGNLKKQDNYKELCNNGIICWHSDDYPYNVSDILKIYMKNEEIILEFTKNKVEDYNKAVSIRFRNSRSHYAPFNCFFMDMYNELNEYDPDYHQIHLEEVGYQKKMKRM